VLRTVGIDIGSTTSHAMFARLRLQRLAASLSSRYVVVEREVLHRSPIVLTPYSGGNTIDASALKAHVGSWYASMVFPAEYGVRTMGERCKTARSTTT
jgi:ethanolamine utilization protein EutA